MAGAREEEPRVRGNIFRGAIRTRRYRRDNQPGDPQEAAHATGCCDFKTRLCRVVIVLIIVVLLIVIVVLVVLIAVKSKCPPDCKDGKLAMTSPCGDSWILYQSKCYYFSVAEGDWPTANETCNSMNSSLAVFDDQQELAFAIAHKGKADRWFGLRKDQSNMWRWSNGSTFNPWFQIGGGSNCSYLNNEEASSARCSSSRHWMCTKETLAL